MQPVRLRSPRCGCVFPKGVCHGRSLSVLVVALLVLPDPGIGPGDIGYYEIEILYSDGSPFDTLYAWRSCAEEPFLMRGYLAESTVFAPCTGQRMLECEIVSLFYAEMNEHVATNEPLEIYGWVVTLDDRNSCTVPVTES